MKTKFLVTGSNGFVGNALCLELIRRGFALRAATRKDCASQIKVEGVVIEDIVVADINSKADLSKAVLNCDVVVHLAARVHVMQDFSTDPLSEFRKVNVAATELLARCAAANGAKRFVYVSSIKVNGEETEPQKCFSERGIPKPQDPYGISKWEAEQVLRRVATETGLEIVVIRPPLVYGQRVKGNFLQLLRLVSKGIPLPLAAIKNRRDFIYVGNLVDALITCATHPNAAGKTYLVSDGEAVSTPDLLRSLAKAMGVSSRLFYVPVWMLKLAGKLLGKSAHVGRLVSSLQVDSSKIRRELDWVPPYSLAEGLSEAVRDT